MCAATRPPAIKQCHLDLPLDRVAPYAHAYELLVDFLTVAVKEVCHCACDPAMLDKQILKAIVNSSHLDRFDVLALDKDAIAKHIHLLGLITKDKDGHPKEWCFVEWCKKCLHVRERVLTSRPAAQLPPSTVATERGCGNSDAKATLSEEETSRCYQLLQAEGGA